MEQSVKSIDPDTYELLTQNQMFNGFKEGEIPKVFSVLNPLRKCVPKGAVIISAGEDAHFMWIICSGIVMASDFSGDNDQQILALHERGELIGLDGVLSSAATSPLTYTAIADSELLCFDAGLLLSGSLDTVMTNKILLNLNKILAIKCVRLVDKTGILATLSLRVRIMTYLRIQMREQDTIKVKVSMDRNQLAQYLCVNRSALSRELSKMQRDGLISLEPDGIIKVLFPPLPAKRIDRH